MKLNKIDEVWNNANLLFMWSFGLLSSKNFSTMTTWRNDFSSLLWPRVWAWLHTGNKRANWSRRFLLCKKTLGIKTSAVVWIPSPRTWKMTLSVCSKSKSRLWHRGNGTSSDKAVDDSDERCNGLRSSRFFSILQYQSIWTNIRNWWWSFQWKPPVLSLRTRDAFKRWWK